MKHARMGIFIGFVVLVLISALMGGCATGATKHATSVVDYLFPAEKEPVVAPGIPVLTLPLRVGIAFVPSNSSSSVRGNLLGGGIPPWQYGQLTLTENKKSDLMREVASNFKKYPFVKDIELIPSAYLRPGGSFDNLDQIRTMYGIDIITLLSYDQVQFTDEGMLSFTYWTIVGAYVIPGEKNDTQTMLDAVVYDIPSRKMLFRAPGTSLVKGSATLVNQSEALRADSGKGFDEASKEMIVNLDEQLSHFKEKVKERPEEFKVVLSKGYTGGGTGGGSVDLISLVMIAGLGGCLLWMRKRS